MIRIFGKGKSVSYMEDGPWLTEKDKQDSILVKDLPEKNTPVNHTAFLALNEKNIPYWYYVDVSKEIEEQIKLERKENV
jgi:hypothetical protein